ncbi:MAG: GIY-YIG nuclease family protein [Anaerolineae bacterium]|jgi:hypothetical protein|nr:GIY-YIG nuclease family protein [Anaerolineae bacterium]MBT7073556.1 GIY-YIG nuclease family protein [Anaerolineae bacterium]MBT7783144.1 GIY-YIG nuclease family protein [Anaerolineae bacterium]
MKNIDKVRGMFLREDISEATNSEILVVTGIKPHQQVHQLTSRLVDEGFLSYRVSGREKIFFLTKMQNSVQEEQEKPTDNEHQQIQALLEIGFEAVGVWVRNGDTIKYILTKHSAAKKVLYVFTSEGEIVYIGKTVQKLSQRLYGYINPGPSQSTNIKNNEKIKTMLRQEKEINIFVFAPQENEIIYRGIPVNLAAGLEDNLITLLKPLWNDTGKR